jgi:hypothetical protein
MRVLSWLYNGIINLIAVSVVAGMFRIAQTPFETIVVTALTLLYVGIANHGVRLAIASASHEAANYSRFLTLRALLGTPADESEGEILNEKTKRVEEPGAALWINMAGLSLMGAVALYHLAVVIWGELPV